MKFNKKFLLVLPFFLVTIATFRFVKDRLSPLRFTGTVEATQVIISSRLSSNILKTEVSEGDFVIKNAKLLSLDCEDINVTYSRFKEDFDRARNLSKSGSTSKESYDKAYSLYKEIEIKRNWCDLKSPIEGIITNRFHEAGEYVTPGTKLFSILDQNDFWVYFYIPQTFINRFKLNDHVKMILPETNELFQGKITKINENAEFTPKNVQTFDERARLVYGIKVKLDNSKGRLKPGMSVDWEIEKK